MAPGGYTPPQPEGTVIYASERYVAAFNRQCDEWDELREEVGRLKKQLAQANAEVFRLRNQQHRRK